MMRWVLFQSEVLGGLYLSWRTRPHWNFIPIVRSGGACHNNASQSACFQL